MNKRFDGIDSDEKSSFTSILYRYSGKMEENILFWGYAISFLNAAIVYFSGGTTMVFSNLNYIPIAMVSSNCKKCSRIIHAVVTAFLIGPLMPLDTKLGISQTTLNWTTRLGIYIIIACAIGIFSDLNKRHGEDLARILSTDWFGYMLKNWKRKHTAVQIYSYNRKDKEYCKKYCESQKDNNMKTVAEGIETQEIADECMAMGLDFMQGYLYHRPELIKSAEPGTKLLNLQLSEK